MDNYLYTCHYCGKDYKPNRRKVQKYCSNSCRTRAFVIKSGKGLVGINPENKKKDPIKIEKMSFAGVGNAAVGTLAINLATSLLTSEENKPATKKDLENLFGNLKQRYNRILNLPAQADGKKAFYDTQTKCIVYLISRGL